MSCDFLQNYTQLPKHFYSPVKPESLIGSRLIHSNQNLMQQLGIELPEAILAKMTSGQEFSDGLMPIAQKYTGHQFGYYNPDLGDGRGLLLGQILDKTKQPWDLHLKGSGQTPFSRRGDGRAVLRSAIREYLIGEALHNLGVPSTRCLSLAKGAETVQREQSEPRASYIRIAKTHIRFGHFEWLKQRGDIEEQKQLADYVIATVYPELNTIAPEDRYSTLLKTIVKNTAIMIAGWQKVGFCHGVMNTDNMSVAGETFDFGPYAFLDDTKVHYICNHSDTEGRYAFSQQPNIGLWNCQVLCYAFSDMVDQKTLDEIQDHYIETFNQHYLNNMAEKFGLYQADADDRKLIAETLLLMDQSGLDFHYFFAKLKFFNTSEEALFLAMLPTQDSLGEAWLKWCDKFRQRLSTQPNEKFAELTSANPTLILRNYIAQEIISAAENDDYEPLNQWMQALQKPVREFDQDAWYYTYLLPPTSQQKGIALSCSS